MVIKNIFIIRKHKIGHYLLLVAFVFISSSSYMIFLDIFLLYSLPYYNEAHL